MSVDALLTTFAAAVEAGDGNKLADCFTADGVYDDYFFGPSPPGRAGIVGMLAHFYEGGRDFKWEFFDIVETPGLAYASYQFSYTSTIPEAKGARVTFAGIAKLALAGGRIASYSEVFDRGLALAQLDFAPERLKKVMQRYAARLRERPEWAMHLAAGQSQ